MFNKDNYLLKAAKNTDKNSTKASYETSILIIFNASKNIKEDYKTLHIYVYIIYNKSLLKAAIYVKLNHKRGLSKASQLEQLNFISAQGNLQKPLYPLLPLSDPIDASIEKFICNLLTYERKL